MKLPFSIYSPTKEEKYNLARSIFKGELRKMVYTKVKDKYKVLCPHCLKVQTMTFQELKIYKQIGVCPNCFNQICGNTRIKEYHFIKHGKLVKGNFIFGYQVTFDVSFNKIKNIKTSCVYFCDENEKHHWKKGLMWGMGGNLYYSDNKLWKKRPNKYGYYGSVENGMYDMFNETEISKKQYLDKFKDKNLLKSNQIYIAKNNHITHQMLMHMIKFDLNKYEELIENIKFIKSHGVRDLEKKLNIYALKYLVANNIGADDYDDYLDQCTKLGIKDKYPTNFNEKHEKYTKMLQDIEDKSLCKKLNKLISKQIKRLSDNSFSKKGVEIVPFKNCQQLRETGKELSLCIYDYKEQYAEGKCELYQVLNNKEISCAIEIRNKKIKQVRSKCNGDPDKSINKIIKQWSIDNHFEY